jgi:hypothetical protein
MDELTTCADCGAPIEKVRLGWGKRLVNDDHERSGFNFCCRVQYELSGERPRLISADYHYVDGETQRHFEPQP